MLFLVMAHSPEQFLVRCGTGIRSTRRATLLLHQLFLMRLPQRPSHSHPTQQPTVRPRHSRVGRSPDGGEGEIEAHLPHLKVRAFFLPRRTCLWSFQPHPDHPPFLETAAAPGVPVSASPRSTTSSFYPLEKPALSSSRALGNIARHEMALSALHRPSFHFFHQLKLRMAPARQKAISNECGARVGLFPLPSVECYGAGLTVNLVLARGINILGC